METQSRSRLSVKTEIISKKKFQPTPGIESGNTKSVGNHTTPMPPGLPKLRIDDDAFDRSDLETRK